MSTHLKMQKIKNIQLKLLLIIALWAVAINVFAADFIWIKSDDGSPVAGGGEAFYDLTNATLSVGRNTNNGLSVSYAPTNEIFTYVIGLTGPDSSEIIAGQYDDAQTNPQAGQPGIFYSAPGGFCSGIARGSFIVHEVIYLTDGSVDSLAADVTLYCGNNLRKSTIYIRHNSSVSVGPVGPIADAGVDQVVLPNANVLLDGSASYSTDAVAFTYQWQQIEGTSVTLTGADQVSPTFTAPSLTSNFEFLRFRVTITDTLNRQSTDTVTVTVSSSLQPRTLMVLRTNSNDWLGRVTDQVVDPSIIPWKVVRSANNGIDIIVDCPNAPPNTLCSSFSDLPGFELTTADNSDPAIGPSDASYSLSAFINEAGITINNECNISHYHILDVVYQENGAIDRLAVNFYSDCQNGMQGFMRINSALPYLPHHPLVSAGRDRVYFSGETVTLDGTHTWDMNIPAVNYVWRQISGPAVTIDNSNSPVASFTAPDVAMSGGDMVFELTVTNEQGLERTDSVTIRVLGDQDPKTYIFMYESPSDYYNRWYIAESAATITADYLPYFSAGNRLTIIIRPANHRSYFMAPGGAEIVPGVYYIEQNSTSTTADTTGVIQTSPNSVCSAEKGQYIVHEIEIDAVGQVTKLALDFSHHCDDFFSGSRTTFGVIRINSLTPRSVSAPVAVTGPNLFDFVGNTVTLDASQSWNVGGDIVSYQWQQTSGVPVILNNPNSMRATFVAPDVAVGSEAFEFQLTATDQLSNTSSRIMSVNVYPNSTTQSAAWYRERNQSIVITPDTSTSAVWASELFYTANEHNGVEVSLGLGRLRVMAENRRVLGVGVYDDAGEYSGAFDYRGDSIPA